MKKDFCVVKLVGKGGDSLLESGENAAGESDSDGKYLDEDHVVWCTEVGIILHFELTIILHILHILNILHILHIWMRTMWCGAQKLVLFTGIFVQDFLNMQTRPFSVQSIFFSLF